MKNRLMIFLLFFILILVTANGCNQDSSIAEQPNGTSNQPGKVFVQNSTVSNRLGSISGNIYLNDIIYNNQVLIYCIPLDRNVHITHGDPSPPYLIIDAVGTYKIDELPEADYYLWVVATKVNLWSDGFRLVTIQAAQDPSNIDFELVPSGSISGGFLDTDGKPVPGAGGNQWIAMYSIPVGWEYIIDVAADGTYSRVGLLPAEYQIYSNLIQRQPFARIIIESGRETHYDFSISDNYP